MLELRLAWRNVWRNPRRTGLTVAATVFAIVLVMVAVALGAGVHEKMIEDAVRYGSGHVSIAGAGWLENRTLEQFVRFDPALERAIRETDGVRGYAPRVSSFALLSKANATSGVAVLGVDPQLEDTVSVLSTRVRRGGFLTRGGRREIVLGERLASKLSARVGDSLLLYSVAYSLETAYELFDVVGVMNLPDATLDRNLAVVSLADAQDFFVYGDRVSEIAILADDADRADGIAAALRAKLAGAHVEVNTWDEVMPDLVEFIVLDDAGMYIMVFIVVVVVGFGILNTILMAVLERRKEFGVVLALGLKPRSVFRTVFVESMLLAAVGLVIGLAIAFPLVLYLQANPIPLAGEEMARVMEMFGAEPVITFKLKPLNPIGSSLTIVVLALVAALYPAVKASRGRPVDVLRSL